MMKVTKCICYDCSFKEIKERLDNGEELNNIIQDTCVGTKCGMCIPYIEITVETGKTEHDVIRNR